MARIVMKFGGTSMAGTERIRNVAARVKHEVDAGNEVAVVVSAMAGETDRLVNFCREAAPLHDPKEYDVVVAAGEQVTSGLLAITLQAMGVKARSWLGWQLPIQTTDAHATARIETIDTTALMAAMSSGEVAVIPGFQGMTTDNRITTLGRGGSDTSAVAVAAAVKADRCDIYTDVDGVYTTDPRIVPRARKLTQTGAAGTSGSPALPTGMVIGSDASDGARVLLRADGTIEIRSGGSAPVNVVAGGAVTIQSGMAARVDMQAATQPYVRGTDLADAADRHADAMQAAADAIAAALTAINVWVTATAVLEAFPATPALHTALTTTLTTAMGVFHAATTAWKLERANYLSTRIRGS